MPANTRCSANTPEVPPPNQGPHGVGLRVLLALTGTACCLLIGCCRKAPLSHWLLPAVLGGLENSLLKRAGLQEL